MPRSHQSGHAALRESFDIFAFVIVCAATICAATILSLVIFLFNKLIVRTQNKFLSAYMCQFFFRQKFSSLLVSI